MTLFIGCIFSEYMPCINVFDCICVFEDINIELLQLKVDQGKELGTKGLVCCQDAKRCAVHAYQTL